MAKIILLLFPLVLIGCGTISAQDYTNLAIEKAVQDARAQAAEDDRQRREAFMQEFKLWLEQNGFLDGRRPHRPSGT